MTLKVQILQTMRRLFIILIGLTWFSEKKCSFSIFGAVSWCPTWLNNLGWYVMYRQTTHIICSLYLVVCKDLQWRRKKTSQRPTPKYRNCMGLTIKFPFFPRKYVENEQNAHCDCVGIHIKDWKDRYAPMILVRF